MPIRPLSFRELLDEPFALVQADIRSTAGCAGVLLVAGTTMAAAFIGLVFHLSDGSDTGTALAALGATLIVAWIIRTVLRGVTVAIGLARARGVPIGVWEALWQTGQRWGALLVVQLSFTAVGLAAVAPALIFLPFGVLGVVWFLFVYPCSLLGLAWFRAHHLVATPVLFAERATSRTALARAGLLTSPFRVQRASVWFCRQSVFATSTVPLLGAALFVSDFSGTHRWPFLILVIGSGLLLAAFTEIVESGARVVSYIDLRCRREGMDIRVPESTGGYR